MVIGSFSDLCVYDVEVSKAFYQTLLDVSVRVDHGWYVEMGDEVATLLALVERGHPTVPAAAGTRPSGLLVSFEVDDAARHAQAADDMGCEFVVPLCEELGQRHFMVRDPDGAVVDVIERIPLSAGDVRRLAQLRGQAKRKRGAKAVSSVTSM